MAATKEGSFYHPPKTFGEKPKSFTIEQNGEAYYIGSEVSVLT